MTQPTQDRKPFQDSGPAQDAQGRQELAVTAQPDPGTPSTRDIARVPDLAGSAGRVGPVRTRMPVYVDLLPPCNAGCPAGENIQEWLRLIKHGQEEAVWRQQTRDNPFPAIYGRV